MLQILPSNTNDHFLTKFIVTTMSDFDSFLRELELEMESTYNLASNTSEVSITLVHGADISLSGGQQVSSSNRANMVS